MSVVNLNRITESCDFPPPQRLFDTMQEAHDAMMVEVDAALKEIRANPDDFRYPSADEFVRQMKTLWLEVWSRYYPKG